MTHESSVVDLLRNFKPLDVASYLRLHGWEQVDVEPDRFATWRKVNSARGDFELILPLATSFRDLALRVRELLETLRAEERRPVDEIAEDLASPHADVVRARLAPVGGLDGSLPLDSGAGVFQHMRDLVLAAACAAWSPRPVFSRRKPDQAMQFLREARIGQTRRGSYVVTVLAPVPPQLTADGRSVDDTGDPFARRATRTLANALAAAGRGVQIAAASGRLDALSQAVSSGVSANLCDAISAMNRLSGDRGVEFTVSWAATRAAPNDVPSNTSFTPDAIPYLDEVSRCFRQSAEIEGVEVVGLVQRLERKEGEDSGRITIAGTVDDERRSVVAELFGADHQLAIRAYEARIAISCVGELSRDGRANRLKNVRSLRFANDLDS